MRIASSAKRRASAKFAEFRQRPGEVAAHAHRRQTDLAMQAVRIERIEQGDDTRQQLLGLAIVAERALDFAGAQRAHDQNIDFADLFGEAQRPLGSLERQFGAPDIAVVIAQK